MRREPIPSQLSKQVKIVLLVAIILFVTKFLVGGSIQNDHQCQVSFGKYHGKQYKQNGETLGSKCLVESKFMKVQQHKVKIPGNNDLIDDWLWIDYHDRINVLVQDEQKVGEKELKFLVIEQSKYALEGRMSLAIVGGIIEPGETAESAARREVQEEMNNMQCNDFRFLGRFRTDVNRGMGWVNSYIALDCSRQQNQKARLGGGFASIEDEVGVADTEKQNLKTIGFEELKNAAMKGEFLEVQWSNTVSLALLHLNSNGLV
mmetsp:Transcript_23788/g.33387  ORF Transcript_23788/g.33387 Transcript_23788/m.33387 type:complete len:261 (-) Transcript_23788:1035-1817(-)